MTWSWVSKSGCRILSQMMGKMNTKLTGKYWTCDWVFYLYLFIANFKNTCLIVYWKLFDVWKSVTPSVYGYLHYIAKVTCLWKCRVYLRTLCVMMFKVTHLLREKYAFLQSLLYISKVTRLFEKRNKQIIL